MTDSRLFHHAIIPILTILLFLLQDSQISAILARPPLPFLPTDEGIHLNNRVSDYLSLLESQNNRKRRNLSSTLSLLWPQVVGPIDNGIIQEEDFDSVPMTALEHQLKGIRERSQIESDTRKHVRDLMNFGSPIAKLTLQQMHALHNDMSIFWNRHNRYHPGHFHPTQHIDPAALIIHQTLLNQQNHNPEHNHQQLVITGQIPNIQIGKTAEKKTPSTKNVISK